MNDLEFANALATEVRAALAAERTRTEDRIKALADRIDQLSTAVAERPERGPQGEKGVAGERGERGEPGLPGAPGEKGIDGIPGRDGKDGAPGMDGKDGADGRDGLAGKDGAPGEKGADGLDGKDGAHGKDGHDGVAGKDGAPGLTGKDGAAGRDGIDGKDGSPGLNGKDADPLLLESLVSKAVAAIPVPKDGRDGRDGVATADELRELVKQVVGDAVPVVVAAEMEKRPDPAPRGLWKSDTPDYRRGNFVQVDGQTWQCNVDGTKKQPGNMNDDWTLVAKRGRDGRDRSR